MTCSQAENIVCKSDATFAPGKVRTHGLQLMIEVERLGRLGLDGSHVQAGPERAHKKQSHHLRQVKRPRLGLAPKYLCQGLNGRQVPPDKDMNVML